MKMRLDKFLSHCGFGSRKEVKMLLKKREVLVNGLRMREGKIVVVPTEDIVLVGGQVVLYQKYYYYVLNKPKGVITATKDDKQRTVLDLLKKEDYREDIFPVGRLDKDTTGLLVLTNDGEFSHRVLSPKKHVPKCYEAIVEGIVTAEDGETFSGGVILGNGEECLPAKLEICQINMEEKTSVVRVTINEGKYHQVKRMFESVGKRVLDLSRKSMGDFTLENGLSLGNYRELTAEELKQIAQSEQDAMDF